MLCQSRLEWSKTPGYAALNWLTIQQTAVEMSLRLFFKIIHNKKPRKIFESLYDIEKEDVIKLSKTDLEQMTKLSRKSWRIRVLRYASLIPSDLDPKSVTLKSCLKEWVISHIPKEGDNIFKGKVKPNEKGEDDWLMRELKVWKTMEEHDAISHFEVQDILAAG